MHFTFFHKSISVDEFLDGIVSRLWFSKDVNIHQDINGIFLSAHNKNSFTKTNNIRTIGFRSKNSKTQRLACAREMFPDFPGTHAIENLEFTLLRSLTDVLPHKMFKTDTNSSSYTRLDSRLKSLGYSGVRYMNIQLESLFW